MEKVKTAPSVETKRYEILEQVTVHDLPAGAVTLDLWCPVIFDSPRQRVLDLEIDCLHPYSLKREPEHGNRILHLRVLHPLADDLRLGLRYWVERSSEDLPLNPESVESIRSAQPLHWYLKPERYVDVTPKTLELASAVVGNETNVLEQARRIYGYVTGHMTYDASRQSWKGSTEYALTCTVGNCNDIHALFLSLCRSVGIPARLIMGQTLEALPPAEEDCDVCGYHCWAEFNAPELGWLPVDASCDCRYGTHLSASLSRTISPGRSAGTSCWSRSNRETGSYSSPVHMPRSTAVRTTRSPGGSRLKDELRD